MPDPRNPGHGPDRIPSYGHKYGALHDRIVGEQAADDNFYNGINNHTKAEYICKALRLLPIAFHLDLPLPMEDWALSDDISLIYSGLYFSDLRRQFYGTLIRQNPELLNSEAFQIESEAQFWTNEFNRILLKRKEGILIVEQRVLH